MQLNIFYILIQGSQVGHYSLINESSIASSSVFNGIILKVHAVSSWAVNTFIADKFYFGTLHSSFIALYSIMTKSRNVLEDFHHISSLTCS